MDDQQAALQALQVQARSSRRSTTRGNNDRVVVMPGIYTEPTARAQPTNDPACDKYEITNDESGDPGALSYEYQFHCPNDQNLIAVMGRAPGNGPSRRARRARPPRHPRTSGPCIRCNLQIEGSGVSADDVVIDAGRVESGNGGPGGAEEGRRHPRRPRRRLRAAQHDRPPRQGARHLRARVRRLPARPLQGRSTTALYGTLTFVEDHGVQQNCEAVGHGDSGIYPGAAVETGEQRAPGTESATTRRSASATRTTTSRATRGRTATPSTSTTTTSTTTRSASDRRRHRRRPPRLPRRLDAGREQQHLLEQLQPLRARTPT